MRRDHHPPPAIGVAGWKNSGKTTLVTRLIAELTRRGFKVATVKHAHHDFQIDDAETDRRCFVERLTSTRPVGWRSSSVAGLWKT